MITVIAQVLRNKVELLGWVERVGGLVTVAERPTVKTGADFSQVVTGTQFYPVASDVNDAECWENGVYKLLEPDSAKSSIVFFRDLGGVQMVGYEGPKRGAVRFKFDLGFYCWLNLARLGDSITAGGSTASGRVAPYFVDNLMGEHTAIGVFSGGIEEDAFINIEVSSISEMRKSRDIFSPFDFERKSELFLYPYDFLGLRILGEFVIPTRCLPTFAEGWTPEAGCLPSGNIDWFQRVLQLLPIFSSNEDALAGNLYGGGTIPGLSVGEYYVGAPDHVAFSSVVLRVE
jgi:hypothetical protein